MFKIFQTVFFIFFVLILSYSQLSAQNLSAAKDIYTGQYIKTEIPAGQNIPLPYDPDLVLLYDNGPLVTHPGGGSGGADASALQTAIGLTVYGFGHQISANNSVADDFTFSTDAWNIEQIQFFAYQTGSTTTSTINDIRLQIWNGPPNGGGSVIWGDLTTNRLSSTNWTNIYRVLDTDLLNTQRPVMRVVVQFTPALNLPPGTYWLQWQCGGTLASGPWVPPVTILGQTGKPGANALQNLAGTWGALLDVTFPQDCPFLIFGTTGPPCPVGAASNPFPANGATNVPITGVTATWTNGAGTVNNEVWFGTPGSLVKVYDGAAITSYALPTLNYVTVYQWYIVCKDATCATTGPTWSFTTMQNPLLFQWCDAFANLNNWTIIGPLGLTNWTANNSNSAGGTAPELRMSWTPSFNGLSLIRSVVITGLPNNQVVDWSFNFFFDWYANPSGIVTLAMTYDGGATSTPFFTASDPTGNIGPQLMSGQLTTPGSGSGNAQIELSYNGYSFNTDNVYWDNVCLEFIIPVELASFAATADYGVVELSWITATETNNQGFEVQRSNGGEFETIAFVEGHGTTTETQVYSYEDRTVGIGSYNYRLKQVDFDGTFEYSNVIEVDVPVLREFALEQNYPNPFNPSTTIDFRLAADSRVSLKVFDVLGQEVATLVNTNLVAGAHKVNFDASKLNSGVYLYRIEATGIDGTNFVDVKKMILTK